MILPLVSPLVGRDQFDMVLLGFEAGCRVDPIGEHQAEDACAKVRFQLLDDAGEFLDLTRMNAALDCNVPRSSPPKEGSVFQIRCGRMLG